MDTFESQELTRIANNVERLQEDAVALLSAIRDAVLLVAAEMSVSLPSAQRDVAVAEIRAIRDISFTRETPRTMDEWNASYDVLEYWRAARKLREKLEQSMRR